MFFLQFPFVAFSLLNFVSSALFSSYFFSHYPQVEFCTRSSETLRISNKSIIERMRKIVISSGTSKLNIFSCIRVFGDLSFSCNIYSVAMKIALIIPTRNTKIHSGLIESNTPFESFSVRYIFPLKILLRRLISSSFYYGQFAFRRRKIYKEL